MQRKDIAVMGTVIALIAIGLFLTIEGQVLGENTGKIGGVVSVVGIGLYCVWMELVERMLLFDQSTFFPIPIVFV